MEIDEFFSLPPGVLWVHLVLQVMVQQESLSAGVVVNTPSFCRLCCVEDVQLTRDRRKRIQPIMNAKR